MDMSYVSIAISLFFLVPGANAVLIARARNRALGAQNRARIALCNIRTLKPRRVVVPQRSSTPMLDTLLTCLSFLNSLYCSKFNSIFVNTLLNIMDNSAWIVRPYKKTPTIQVPATPASVSPFLSQPLAAPSSVTSGVSPLAHGKRGVSCFLIYRGFDLNSRNGGDFNSITHGIAIWT